MAQYAVLRSDTDQLVVLKAIADPNVDGNWSSVERILVVDPIASLWAVLVGTDLHVATAEAQAGGSRWAYSKLDTLTDTWTIKDEQISTNGLSSTVGDAISLAVRDDGDVIVFYNRTVAGRDEVVYARREGGAWTADIQVDDGGIDNFSGAVIVKDTSGSDRMHFFFQDVTLSDAFQRTLLATNALEAFPAAGDADVSGINHLFGHGMSYDDGGTQRIRCPYRDDTNDVAYAEFDSVDAPGAFTLNTAISDNDVDAQNQTPVMCSSNDGTDEYLLYSDITTFDLFRDKNKTADVELEDAVTVERISCNVYNRSGQKLAYLWQDTGTTRYGEESLAVAAVPGDEGAYMPPQPEPGDEIVTVW